MTVDGLLLRAANKWPEREALAHGERRWTFVELADDAARVARLLRELGVGRGDRVALLLENSLDYVTAFFGALQIGATVVALNHANRSRTHNLLLRDSGAVVLVTRPREARRLPEIVAGCPDLRAVVVDRIVPAWELPAGGPELVLRAEADALPEVPLLAEHGPDDLAAILYTSGSTGTPRGVMLSHGNLVVNTEQILGYLRLTPGDSVCCVLPFHYSFGNSLLLTHVACGGRVVVDNRFAFPAKVLETLEQERCTGFSGVPSHYAILCSRTDFLDRPHEHLRYLTQAGGAMAPALQRRLREALPGRIAIYVMYGQTEASARLSYVPPERLPEKYGSIGIAIPGVTLTVRRTDGSECDTGEVGEIVATGPNIMQGYWNAPQETAAVLKADGLHTGDLAYRDEDGFLWIVDRVKNMIKVGANRVSPKEIEETILELPQLAECCVLGVEDEMLGEAVEAWIVPAAGADADRDTLAREILRHCNDRLAPYKVPRAVHFVDAIPKSASGKVMKEELRRR